MHRGAKKKAGVLYCLSEIASGLLCWSYCNWHMKTSDFGHSGLAGIIHWSAYPSVVNILSGDH
jgi:hypothetical protein